MYNRFRVNEILQGEFQANFKLGIENCDLYLLNNL